MVLDVNAISAFVSRDPDLIDSIKTAPRIAVTLISLGECEFGVLWLC